ncbi:FAD-dependent oxidoreductase [Gracilibacillus salitolerans]|uniref:FAD-dependent oxidoreductase n=1 Tax=Gracilibacillus salitolerans TaxID=2663022 RepID=A0A5Q2TFS5_9BACI|nr:FAD-dependent oxidoreductase [Gracilibacillus salitolerans]QGH33654.1 FAD-dependent oxidoreductase [Gracilibacillus salitolerans]
MNNHSTNAHIHLDQKKLPILFDVDVALVGGSIASVTMALELAKAGKKVVLIESRTYLGREITATLRPWISEKAVDHINTDLIKKIAADGIGKNNEIALSMDKVKLTLEEELFEQGVEMLYASYPLATFKKGEKQYLEIGNKSGRQLVSASVVIDTTENASLLRQTNEVMVEQVESDKKIRFSIEFYRTEGLTNEYISILNTNEKKTQPLKVHQGYLDRGHVILEGEFISSKLYSQDPFADRMEDEFQAKKEIFNISEYLLHEHQAFSNAYLAATSFELQDVNRQMKCKQTENFKGNISTEINGVKVDLNKFQTSNPSIWYLGEYIEDETIAELLFDPVMGSRVGSFVGLAILENWEEILEKTSNKTITEHPSKANYVIPGVRVKEQPQPQNGRIYTKEIVEERQIPILHQSDVLIVGGGTSGATAGIVSGREGLNTVLLEMNPGLGGTATFGAVDSYWFGRRVGFNQWITERVNQMQERVRHYSPKWNIEAKMYALWNEAYKAGVQPYFGSIVIGTIMENKRVRGVVATSRWGTFAILANTVIDATGDGDVAAFAGAEYVYGSQRDHIVMWYSLAQFAKPGRSQNNFTSAVDVSNIMDYTRAILDGRRRKRKRDVHDHGIYVASRETRHVLGEYVMTLTDQLRQRKWDDVVNIHFSNHDMKGKNGADWMHLGLIPPNLEIEIPYRLLLPKGLEGIIVTGKAISATHDGFAAIRMQADLENLGGVSALAAKQSIQNNVPPSQIDIRQLQKRLVLEGLLPTGIEERAISSEYYQDSELEELVEQLTGEEPLYMYADMEMEEVYKDKIPIVEICTVGERILPFLEKGLDQAIQNNDIKRQVALAQALAMYESSYGVPILIDEIEKELDRYEGLPIRDNVIRHTQLPPDQGAMPDVVYLLYTLGMTRDERSIDIWKRIVSQIDPSEESLKDMFTGTFYYVDAVCYGIERLATKGCITILEALYTHKNLRDQLRQSGIVADYFKERQAMLDLAIARALARCGDIRGYRVLINYLKDARALLAEQAHTELRRLTTEDFGKNVQEWNSYVSNQGEFPEQPLLLKLDI